MGYEYCEYYEDVTSLKYTISRRAILNGTVFAYRKKNKKKYNTEELIELALTLEGRNLVELKRIHNKYIGPILEMQYLKLPKEIRNDRKLKR